MRQVILDTETTGLEPELGHRVIEIGCIEVVGRRRTGRVLHYYLRPDRAIDTGALQVHGITAEFLASQPRFADISDQLIEFIRGAELVVHNAHFDLAFLDAEFAQLASPPLRTAEICGVLDTLALARQLHPGQRNGLDALCKRYGIDDSKRQLHGALLDAELLLDAYLAMTGGQGALVLEAVSGPAEIPEAAVRAVLPRVALLVRRAGPDELAAHAAQLAALDRASGGRTVWRMIEAVT
jgi:DNA polymerase-3 subunit epsilon